MGIDLRVETESGGVLTEIADPHGCVRRFLIMADLEATVCLRFIDPYGDTVFNRSQMPVVQSEIEAAVPRLSMARLRSERKKALEHAIDARWQQSVIDQLRTDVGTDLSRGAELEGVRRHMLQILEAVRMAITSGPHVYLKFVGD
jgi:hypothetical protein